jgi:hypothetical protein
MQVILTEEEYNNLKFKAEKAIKSENAPVAVSTFIDEIVVILRSYLPPHQEMLHKGDVERFNAAGKKLRAAIL